MPLQVRCDLRTALPECTRCNCNYRSHKNKLSVPFFQLLARTWPPPRREKKEKSEMTTLSRAHLNKPHYTRPVCAPIRQVATAMPPAAHMQIGEPKSAAAVEGKKTEKAHINIHTSSARPVGRYGSRRRRRSRVRKTRGVCKKMIYTVSDSKSKAVATRRRSRAGRSCRKCAMSEDGKMAVSERQTHESLTQ